MSASMAIWRLFDLLMLLMIVRVFLTWIPNINWYNQPFKLLKDISDPIFEPFRRILPPIGGLDLSPILAFIVIGLIQRLIVSLMVNIGL